MPVYPRRSGYSAAAVASASTGNAIGKPKATHLTSQPPPPPSYTHGANQPSVHAYGFDASVATAPAEYSAPVGYSVAPTSYGNPSGQAVPQTQPQNYQNVSVSVINATTSPQVTVVQPEPVIVSPRSYLGWSIFNFLCCFWPLGLAAIIYSVKVRSARNHEEAKKHSLTARNLNIAATTIAPILAIVVAGAVVGTTAQKGLQHNNTNITYYLYGYYYYYTYLVYYTYSMSYSYTDYSSFYSYYYGSTVYYSFTATGYQSVTASNNLTTFTYQYAQGVKYSGATTSSPANLQCVASCAALLLLAGSACTA